jgi:hypothetical protein
LSEAETIKLTFKAPDVAPLPEVATVARAISLINNTVEGLTPRTHPVSVERKDGDSKPEPLRRLVIREVTYGSDLLIVLLAPRNVASFIPAVLRSLRSLKAMDKERMAQARRQNKIVTEMSFGRLLGTQAGDNLKDVYTRYATRFGVDPELLLKETKTDLENLYKTNIEILG